MEKPKPTILFIINGLILLCGIATAFSGLTIMLHFHMGHPGAISTTDTFRGLHYFDWSWVHKASVLSMTLLIVYHILLHWKWYKNVLQKRLLTKNRQVLLLTIIFTIAFLTGFIPWLHQLTNVRDITRRFLLEIHDKNGIVLIVFLILHVSKRFKWFKDTYVKLKL